MTTATHRAAARWGAHDDPDDAELADVEDGEPRILSAWEVFEAEVAADLAGHPDLVVQARQFAVASRTARDATTDQKGTPTLPGPPRLRVVR